MDESSFLDVALAMSELSVPNDLYVLRDTMVASQESSSMSRTSGKAPFFVRPPATDVPSGSMLNGDHDDLIPACKPNSVASSKMTHAPSSPMRKGDDGGSTAVESVESFPSHSVLLPSATPNKATVSYLYCPMITHVDDTVKRYNFWWQVPVGPERVPFVIQPFAGILTISP
jgi:hypothetical protein